METRKHVIEVLKIYPNAMIVISHDDNFLAELNITHTYKIAAGTLKAV